MVFSREAPLSEDNALPVSAIDPDPVLIAGGVALAAGEASPPVAQIRGGSYIWAYQYAGTANKLVLEYLGPDGATWATLATSGASQNQGVVIGSKATLRLRNSDAAGMSSIYSTLS